ncbi:MAG: M28 family peptidase [Gammaproteobacteria bacterium]|nr:MAG: M28 family peptidase [Gammaproteobacteria bacterium]
MSGQAGLRRLGKGLLLAVACAAASGAATASDPEQRDTRLEARLRAHIEFLASDLLRGRQPGTAGYDIAAAYVASQMAQAGLAPAGEQGGWYQQVPLRRAYLVNESATMSARNGNQSAAFTFLEHFFTGPDVDAESSAVTAPTVFVGYGIEATELEHNDYQGLDVAGKIAVILSGMPAEFPSEEGAHFASYREKDRAAFAHGAVGVIRVHTPRRDRRVAWARYADRVGAPSMAWIGADGEPHAGAPDLQTNAILHHSAAAMLFHGAQHSLEELIALDEAGAPLPTFPLRAEVSAAQRSRHDALTSANVVGMLQGTDPRLNGEYLVYLAHLDHIGELAHAEEGADGIHNGALDNASGISVMLETARIFAEGPGTGRSILFLAVTAEEKGLVGSEYFALNPTVPVDSMVGAVNLDMPLLLYDFGDVIAFGAEHSSLGPVVGRAAGEMGIELTPDPMPEENIFVRSDHYRFVQRGIPSVFLVTGPKARDGVTDTGPIFQGFLQKHYHKPSDDLSLPIHYGAAVRFTRINHRIGEIIANDPDRPAWVEGDFFGRTYAR